MTHKRFNANLTALFTLSLGLSSGLTAGLPFSKLALASETPRRSERMDRAVDQVALEAQDQAILRLNKSLKKYKGTEEEADLIFRLAQSYQQSANIQFRIVYGQGATGTPSVKKSSGGLTRYKKTLLSSIQFLDPLIDRFPRFADLDQAFFMRGKAYEELEDAKKAKANYLELVKRFPQSERTLPAYMALADIEIKNKDHLKAIESLLQVEKYQDSPFYPFALYKLAWAYYNLQQMGEALGFIKRHVKFYDALAEKDPAVSLVSSDNAMRENSLMDLVLFYGEGFERHPEHYQITKALDYFKGVEKGPLLGKMTLQLTKYLRSHQHDAELLSWRDLLLEEEPNRPETIESLISVFEYQLNQKHYAQATLTAKALSRYTDPRVIRIYFNLAEILFQIGEFEKSTEHYRWIVQNWNQKSGLSRSEVELKSISSRYEALRKAHLIPEQLSARKLDSSNSAKNQKLPPLLAEWIDWIDHFSPDDRKAEDGKKETDKAVSRLDGFEFDANRALYQTGNNTVAVERLIGFIKAHSQSSFAIPSATLVLDTYIASEKWAELLALGQQWLKIEWTETAAKDKLSFKQRLAQISSDSAFKVMEEAYGLRNLTQVIALGETYLKLFAKSSRSLDYRMMMAQARAQMGQADLAKQQLTEIIQEGTGPKQKKAALFYRAQLAEQNYEFDSAIEDYQAVLKAQANTQEEIEAGDTDKLNILGQKLPFLVWLSQKQVLSFRCETLKQDQAACKKYWALSQLKKSSLANLSTHTSSGKDHELNSYVHLALKGEKSERAIWGSLALKQSSQIEVQRKLWVIREIAKNWDKLDPLIRFSLVPALTVLIPKALKESRAEIGRAIPMNRPSAKSILRRVEWIQEIEKSSEALLSLPWARLRTETLFQVAETYRDFTDVLEKHTSLEGLDPAEREEYEKSIGDILKPFSKKTEQLAKKAYETATENGVEEEVIKEIATVYPQVAKDSKSDSTSSVTASLKDEEILSKMSGGENTHIKQWMMAFRQQASEKALYFLLEVESKHQVSEPQLKLIRGLTLKSLGAQAEGLKEISEGLEKMKPEGGQLETSISTAKANDTR